MGTLLDDLKLSWFQVNKLSHDKYKVVCNEAWLAALRTATFSEADRSSYLENLPSAMECKLLLEPSDTSPCHDTLHRLHVYIIARQGRVRRSRVQHKEYLNTHSTLGQYMCMVQYEVTLLESRSRSTAVQTSQPNTLTQEVFDDLLSLLSSSLSSHPANQELVGHLVTQDNYYLCFKHSPYTLKDVICYTPSLLAGSHRPLFVVYQLLQYLRWLHSHGLTHDNLCTTNLYIDESLWLVVGGARFGIAPVKQTTPAPAEQTMPDKSGYPFKVPADSLLSAAGAWIKGYLSNLDYLLLLNKFSGRVMGDPNLHPIVPWVMDFSSSYGGWRDLGKSKFRLNKGDYHLDSTYKIHGLRVSPPTWLRARRSFHEEDCETTVTPHHLIDTLSEITYFSYLARRMPKNLLCKHVRSKWEPQEYPCSMSHLYTWTPDECIPEFYTDEKIFTSVHSDLPDLILPPWANDSSDFIKKHRDALEGDYVSSRLHSWIDLMFGDKLFGSLAVTNKNVYKELVDNHKTITNKGVRQLFQFAHPKRLSSTPPIPHLPLSTHEIVSKVEVCEEPDYEEDHDFALRRNTYQFGESEVQRVPPHPVQRMHSADQTYIKNIITNRKPLRSETSSLDSVQELNKLIFSPIRMSKDEENLTAKIRYLTQFFSSLGGSIWIDKEAASSPTDPSELDTSLAGRQRRDLQGVGCILIEVLASHNIPEYEGGSWEKYLSEAVFLWNKNRDDIFLCYNELIEYLLYSEDIFCTTQYLLHQHSSVLAIPAYFDSLYQLLYHMEQKSSPEDRILYCGNYFKNNPKFLASLGNSGMLILLGNLKPLFYGPYACKAFVRLFDTIAIQCSQKSLEVLSAALEHFYHNTSTKSERMMLSNINFVMSVKRHLGAKQFLCKFIGFIVDDIVDTECTTTLRTGSLTKTQLIQPSLLATECYSTLKQLLPTLSPILTANYVTSKLLQALVGCHVFNEDLGMRCGGEELVTKFLIDIALVYGEAFIDTQYIPRVFNMVKSAMFRVTNKNEGKLLAALNVMRDSIKCLDGTTLHNMLEDLQTFLLEPIMRLLTSSRILFPHSGSGRILLCKSLSQLLILIVKHVQYSFVQDLETGKQLLLPMVKHYFLMFDAVSYLYMEDITVTEGADIISPSQSLDRTLDADYFLHLKHQFPSYPKRYHSTGGDEGGSYQAEEDESCHIEVGSSPVSGDICLADVLQMETENIAVEKPASDPVSQDTSSDPETPDEPSDEVEDNIHISLMPPGDLISHDPVRPVSMVEIDTDPDQDSSSYDKAAPDSLSPRHDRHSSTTTSLSSDSESDVTIPDDPIKDIDCLSDGSKRERAIQAQIEACLTPEIAQNTYVQLCRLIGQETLRRTLDNIDLVEVLAYMDIPMERSVDDIRSRYHSDSSTTTPYIYPSHLTTCKPFDQCCSLSDNWRRVWEGSVTSTNDVFTFRHIFLQQYRGHSDRVNALEVTEDECFLLSGSKDKSVILWDLRATSTGLGHKVKRFEEHSRPVLGLTYLNYSSTVVSMDNQQIICMDLEREKVVSKLDSKNGLVLTALPRSSHRIIQGTSDSTLRIFDTRVRDTSVMEWRVATPLRSVHVIKALECDPTGAWVAAGFSSGSVNVLDLRVGIVLHAFRPHHQDITQILCSDNGEVYTSSSDSAVSVCYWKRSKSFTEGHQPDNKYQAYRDGVTGMRLMDEELVTCANQRLTTFTPAGNTSTKLRSDYFRGGVSAMAVLKLNKLLVLGCDGGSVRLLA